MAEDKTAEEKALARLEPEFTYYRGHQAELVEKYRDQFVVIKGGSVVGAYATYEDAYVDASKNHELGTFLIQQVEPGEGGYTQSFHSRVA